MDYQDTRNKVHSMMLDIDGRLLSQIPGPNKTGPLASTLEFWNVGGACVIVQYWKTGGCHHYVSGNGATWEKMEAQLREIKEGAIHE